MPIVRNADCRSATPTNVIKVHLHSYLEKLLSVHDNELCLSAEAFKFLVTMSSVKRKRNVLMIETKLETIDQLAIGVSLFSGSALQWYCYLITQKN